jgi:hypothetical protein
MGDYAGLTGLESKYEPVLNGAAWCKTLYTR